jgi:hypothetical protein
MLLLIRAVVYIYIYVCMYNLEIPKLRVINYSCKETRTVLEIKKLCSKLMFPQSAKISSQGRNFHGYRPVCCLSEMWGALDRTELCWSLLSPAGGSTNEKHASVVALEPLRN